MYSLLNYANKAIVKWYTHGRRMEIARQIIEEYEPASMLDYGNGDGTKFLRKHLSLGPHLRYMLCEPILIKELKD